MPDLLELRDLRLADLLETQPGDDSTLDDLMRRIFDPERREYVTVSAFGSVL